MKKIFALLLAMLMLVSCLSACAGTGDNTDTESADSVGDDVTESATEEETTEPEVNYIPMLYDDRTAVAEVIGKNASSIEIKDQVVTSKKTGSSDPDAEVLQYDSKGKRLIAVGTGTATVVADGEEFPVKVSPAPITIVLVTGHSLGMGSQGNKEQSVLCEAGQVYMSDGAEGQLIKVSDTTALGYTAAKRPLGIDTLTKDGGKTQGRQGVDGALGSQWNKLTGEKIWIVNCAVGGSCVNQWQKNEMHNRVATKALNCASTVIKNEVAAGHYIYKTTAHINFACANFGYQKVDYNDEKLYTWHDGLWESFVEGSTVDIDGDGKVDGPTCLGYVPLWASRDGGALFNEDAPIIHYRAASKEYSHVFIASNAHRNWLNDADVKKYFPKVDYTTHDGKTVKQPTTLKEIDADGVHLTQLGYNAQGQDIANNLYAYLRTEVELKDVILYNITTNIQGVKVSDNVSAAKGKTYKFAIVCDPAPVSDLEITVDGVLELSSPFHVTVKSAGEGTLTIKHGDKVLKTVTFSAK